jgi:flagellin-like protein
MIRMNRMKKGITPIISTIILLLVTIALAATAYSYLSGFMTGQTANTMTIPNGGLFCSGGKITLIVRNDGTDVLRDTAITIHTINGTNVALLSTPFTIPSRGSATIIDSTGPGGNATWTAGTYQVVIGTSANILRENVYCP